MMLSKLPGFTLFVVAVLGSSPVYADWNRKPVDGSIMCSKSKALNACQADANSDETPYWKLVETYSPDCSDEAYVCYTWSGDTGPCPYGIEYSIDIFRCVSPPKNCKNPKRGNPVEVASGRKIQKFTDYVGKHIKFVRNYYHDGYGYRWGNNLQEQIKLIDSPNRRYIEISSNGKVIVAVEQTEDCWRQPGGGCYRVVSLPSQIKVFHDNMIKTYDDLGRIQSLEIVGSPDKTIHFEYSSNEINISALGENVQLKLNDSHNVTSLSGGGSTISYEYNEANDLLEKVIFTDQSSESYIYTDTNQPLLKELQYSGRTFAHWLYDSKGRVLSSEHEGALDRTTFEYFTNEVLVTGPLGKQTRYLFETVDNVKLVKEIRGEASANCAAASKEYAYYDNGTLKSKTDWEGNVTTYLRDDLGREISRTEAAGTPESRTITTEYHPTLNKPVKITEPGKVTTMTYDAEGRLLSNTTQSTVAP